MPLFLGKFPYVVDEKGRVNIPARFREQMGKETDSTLAVFKGMDGCIFVYPQSTLDTFRSNFDKSQFRQVKNARLLQRLMADGGSTGIPDGQGRITLSPEQREYADLKRDVVIFGNFERIEIWNPERLAAHLADAENQGLDMDDLAGAFFGEPGAKAPGDEGR
jgi:MraZ protein